MSGECIYGFGTSVDAGFDETLDMLEGLLEKHGFKIYTRLNVQDITEGLLCEKFMRYVILGACNPKFAKELFNSDPNIGLLIPCNIIVYEQPGGGCKVMIKDPARIMDMIDNPYAIQASIEVKEQMEQIVEELSSSPRE